MNNLSDEALFQALRSGEENALSLLFLRHYDHLHHYGTRLVKDRALIEDCIQDLFAYIFESAERLGEISHVRAYLFSSFRRRLFACSKKERERFHLQSPAQVDFDIRFSAPDLFNKEDSEEVRKAMFEALNRLSWRQREAVYLKYYNGLRTKEIAEIMDIAPQTVLNTLYQAISKIRQDAPLKKLLL